MRNYTVYVSQEAWESIPRPRWVSLSKVPVGPVYKPDSASPRRRRCLRLPDEVAGRLEAIALVSDLRNRAHPHPEQEGLIGLAVEAIGQDLFFRS